MPCLQNVVQIKKLKMISPANTSKYVMCYNSRTNLPGLHFNSSLPHCKVQIRQVWTSIEKTDDRFDYSNSVDKFNRRNPPVLHKRYSYEKTLQTARDIRFNEIGTLPISYRRKRIQWNGRLSTVFREYNMTKHQHHFTVSSLAGHLKFIVANNLRPLPGTKNGNSCNNMVPDGSPKLVRGFSTTKTTRTNVTKCTRLNYRISYSTTSN